MPCGRSLFSLFLNTIKICLGGINIKWGHRGTRQPRRAPCHREDERRAGAAVAAAVPAHPGKQLWGGPGWCSPPVLPADLAPIRRAGRCSTAQLGPGCARSRWAVLLASVSLPVAAARSRGSGVRAGPAQRALPAGAGAGLGPVSSTKPILQGGLAALSPVMVPPERGPGRWQVSGAVMDGWLPAARPARYRRGVVASINKWKCPCLTSDLHIANLPLRRDHREVNRDFPPRPSLELPRRSRAGQGAISCQWQFIKKKKTE